MKVFLSSTFTDLVAEREAVLKALRRKRQSVLAMEDFLATPSTPLDTALQHLRDSDVMILVIGFKAGSLLPNNSGMTYTSAEYSEAVTLGRHVLAFVKQAKRWPWSSRKEWLNDERSPIKAKTLANFRAEVGARCTWEPFTTSDELALAVIQSLEKWENQGRPGARKTFSSAAEFFASKAPQSATPILDFTTSLFGREQELQALNSFLVSDSQSICVVSGRGGIGKSKLLHDWTGTIRERQVVFLKDEPLWHADSDKEVPTGSVVLIVDDAHRSESMGRVAQLFKDFRRRRPMKLVLSTRPGAVAMLTQPLYRDLDPSEIAIVPELQELTKEQALALAREVLGKAFDIYAESLVEVAGNTPLVIVAGGRLIASRRVVPAELSNIEDFRSTVFTRFLDELRLEGPTFAISPTRPLLELIAALGPVDVDSEAFLAGAEGFLNRRRDEILSTLDALGATGIVTRRGNPIRVLPDVVSDFVLEDRCVGKSKRSTQYADHVYASFGGVFFRNLMRNLSELDWRLERNGYGLDLLSGIWEQIENDFLNGDEYGRHHIFDELSSAAVYQPDHILSLINLALRQPIVPEESAATRHRASQAYVVEAMPRLLEATAHHLTHLERSVDLLWEISKQERGGTSDSGGAKAVLKRLASYDLHGWPAFNFAMLLQAIRLSQREDAFEREFTPIALIDMLLEHEGEFTEYSDNVIRFGGFGLNIAAVGPLRQNALDFLEFSLSSKRDVLAVKAARSLGSLLHQYLNRVVRESPESEIAWQNAERLQALDILWHRLQQPASIAVRARAYNAIRSGTGINCPEPVRDAAYAALAKLVRDPELVIFDALCAGDTGLPILTRDFDADSWDLQIRHLMQEAHDALAATLAPASRAALLIADIKTAIACQIEPRGFQRLVHTFASDSEFLSALTDQLLADEQLESLVTQLSRVLDALHSHAPQEFHPRARMILGGQSVGCVRAAAAAVRVYSDNATVEDIAQIKAFLAYPDAWVKGLALQAIAYMGKNAHLRSDLLDAALSVDVAGDAYVATHLADAFGPYGIPLSLLTPRDASRLLEQFSNVEDFDADQGTLPRFLSRLLMLFPDQVLDLLLERIAMEQKARKQGKWNYRSLGSVHGDVSFASLEAVDRLRLAKKCLDVYFTLDEESEGYAKLFWMISGADDGILNLLVTACDDSNTQRTKQIATLIRRSSRRLAFTQPDFARALLGKLSGANQQEVIEAFVGDAHSFSSGPFQGEPNDYFAQHRERIKSQVAAFPSNGELAGLSTALKRSIGS
jgi:hypothetical protein